MNLRGGIALGSSWKYARCQSPGSRREIALDHKRGVELHSLASTLSASSHRLTAPGVVLDHAPDEERNESKPRPPDRVHVDRIGNTGFGTTKRPTKRSASARDIEIQLLTAFNRQDAAGVASLFTEDGFRVTPQGIIQGREAIQKDMDKRFQSHFHDLSATITIVRASGNSIWEAGEWSMMIGDRPVRG